MSEEKKYVTNFTFPNGETFYIKDEEAGRNNNYITPEQFGAVGDGETDDTNAIEYALRSGFPIRGTGRYLVTRQITIDQIDRVEIDGGVFVFNTAGKYDFLYVTNANEIILKNLEVICTDDGFTYENGKGTFLMSYLCKSVLIENVKASNIYYLYRSNYLVTNDNSQFFMDTITINNVQFNNCICPLLVAYCHDVSITNFISLSAAVTRELIYITGGIRNFICTNVKADYASRFYLHFNNSGVVGSPVDNSLRQNWVERFTLSNCTFGYSGNRSIVDTMCPIDKVMLSNIVGADPIYRSYGSSSFSGCICNEIYVSDSDIGAPSLDGIGGDIKLVNFVNCVITGPILQGVIERPIDIAFTRCHLNASIPGSAAWINVVGKLSLKSCVVNFIADVTKQVIVATSELILLDNIFELTAMNRLIFNSQTSTKIKAIGNYVYTKAYGKFIHQNPLEGIVKDNYINNTPDTDIVTKIAVTAVALSEASVSMQVGDTIVVKPVLTPANATNQNTTHQISSTSVASVERIIDDGALAYKVTALSAGSATLTVRATDNTSILATCDITVS